jgi:hypothetical protein
VSTAASVTALLLGMPSSDHSVVQIGFAVENIAVSAAAWSAAVGAGPFFALGDEPLVLGGVTHRGEPARWSHSTSVGQWGRVQIELTEQHSAWPDSLGEQLGVGRYGLHHTAWLVDDMDVESRRLEALGFPQIMRATLAGQEFRFHDAVATLGYRIEIYRALPPVPGVFTAVQHAAQRWDGRDALRPIEALASIRQ